MSGCLDIRTAAVTERDKNGMSEKNRKPELLIPASNLEVLKTAVIFGADAVYIGGEAFGLRAKAKNFPKRICRRESVLPMRTA